MNSQLTYNTMGSHHDDLLRRAEASRGRQEPRRAPRRAPGGGGVSLELRMPRLRPRIAWRRVSFVLSTFTTIAIVALVVTLSSSRAASHSALARQHAVTAASIATAHGVAPVAHRHYHLAR